MNNNGLFTLTKGMTLNPNLADRKDLSSITFVSTISCTIDHGTRHVMVFLEKAKT